MILLIVLEMPITPVNCCAKFDLLMEGGLPVENSINGLMDLFEFGNVIVLSLFAIFLIDLAVDFVMYDLVA